MRIVTTDTFDRDVGRLARGEKELFYRVLETRFLPACDRRVDNPTEPWPASLRVKQMKSRPDVIEFTWEYRDGRATFQWQNPSGEVPVVLLRRVGGHAVLDNP